MLATSSSGRFSRSRSAILQLGTAALLLAGCAHAPAERAAELRGAVIALDPGHPSELGHGATGASGLRESHVTWLVAEQLRPMLESRGIRVVMTRTTEDEVVTNRRRAEIANDADADLMLRLHCDSRAAAGTSTYYPDRQGATAGVTGPSHEVIASSERAARLLHPAMIRAMGSGWPDLGIHGDSKTAVGSRQGALTGSIFSRVPALTIEMVSLSNTADEAFISSAEGRRRMAMSLAAGVEAYLRAAGVKHRG